MANYKAKIDLTKLGKAFVTQGKSGNELIAIDIKESDLYRSEETGSVYLDLVFWEKKDGTHYIKQSFSKDKAAQLKKLSKEERYKNDPILGNLEALNTKATPSATPAPAPKNELIDDGLPF